MAELNLVSTARVTSQLTPEGAPRWMAAAACLDADPELFYPTATDPSAYDEARAICEACPVLQACRDFAMATEPLRGRHGMLGGLTPEERHKLYRRNTRTPSADREKRTYKKGERALALDAQRTRGLELLAQGRTPEEVAVELNVKRPTVYLWRRRNRPGTETT